MSDHVAVEFDNFPWHPSEGTELVEELDHWNRPTLGVIRQHGVDYLFRVLLNTDAGPDLWIYAQLTFDDLRALDQATSPAAINEAVRLAYQARPLVAAATDEDSRIFAVAMVDPLPEVTDGALYKAGAQAIRERTGRVMEQIRRHGDDPVDVFKDELMRL